MIIVNENDVPGVTTEGEFKRTLKVLLSPALDRAIDSIAAGLTIIPPEGKSDFISHAEGEMFYVLFGEGAIRIELETKPITAGTAIWVCPRTTHQLINTGSGVMKVLWVLSPPGRESFILEKSGATAAPGGSPK
jgi:mannose-6-phosphate isomerase-like protein (cupin superfamily)